MYFYDKFLVKKIFQNKYSKKTILHATNSHSTSYNVNLILFVGYLVFFLATSLSSFISIITIQ